uniref:Sushi domain-containing protein n=1 Tax=Chrysemys picta bellii TaxID=8478 RepID=A0A8C3IEI0_CHRPI
APRRNCDSPPRLSFAQQPEAVNNSYAVGTKLKYSCRPGYMLGSGKSPYVTCLANSTWSVDPEFCVGRPCKQLELENGRVHFMDLRFGATANFSSIPCLPPPGITHGSHTGQTVQEFSFGSAVTYKCDQGFSLIGEASIHCTTKDNVNGQWSGPAPECKVVKCPEPEVKNGKKQSGYGLHYSYGNTVIFECDSGYTLKGSSSVKCEANNSWFPSLPTCLRNLVLVICESSPRLSFAELPGVVNDSYPAGTQLKYSCRPGYILGSGKSPFVTCLAKSTWSVDPEFLVKCPEPEVKNGKKQSGYGLHYSYGNTVIFECDSGYTLKGSSSVKCEANNSWFPSLPTCLRKYKQLSIPCLPPPDITHGSHTGQSEQQFLYGSAVTYTYIVNGEWSGPAPECKEAWFGGLLNLLLNIKLPNQECDCKLNFVNGCKNSP